MSTNVTLPRGRALELQKLLVDARFKVNSLHQAHGQVYTGGLHIGFLNEGLDNAINELGVAISKASSGK